MKNLATELCGIDVPVFQAGMAGLAGPELVAAVSNAGGLGHLGGLRQPPSMLRSWIQKVKALTDKPFGVNLVPAYGGPEVFEAQLQVVFEEKPKVLSLFYGDFDDIIPRAKEVGICTMVQVGSVAEAQKVVKAGVDIIVAQGIEAGGHVRGRVGLMSLLPAVLDVAEGRPVIAAGGIVDEVTVRAAMLMGAAGIWAGTVFVASTESLAHDIYKQRLLAAGTDDPKFLTGYSFGWGVGTPHRAIYSAHKYNPLRLCGGGARTTDKAKIAEKLTLYAGQGVGRITKILPAADIVGSLAKGLT